MEGYLKRTWAATLCEVGPTASHAVPLILKNSSSIIQEQDEAFYRVPTQQQYTLTHYILHHVHVCLMKLLSG